MIPFLKPYFDNDDLQAIMEVLQSGWVAQGPKVERFEEAVADYLDCEHVVSVTNCTAALTLSLIALGISKNDEVIIPDFTFPATALAVTNVGAIPITADVEFDTYNINIDELKKLITKRTKAIIPVHLFGLACNMTDIMNFSKQEGLFVIEDAACALGTDVVFDDIIKKAGTIGDIGCFSLHAAKGITTGEGGLVCTNDEELANRIRRLSSFGDERTYRRRMNDVPFYFDPIAGNYKMSDITAALGLSQLHKIDQLTDWRIKVAQEWHEIISEDDYFKDKIISQPKIVKDHTHIYQSYVVVCSNNQQQNIINHLAYKGFVAGIGTHSCSRYPNVVYNNKHKNSDYLFRNSISLPRYYGLEVKKEWEKVKA